jgi:hypothetical protein
VLLWAVTSHLLAGCGVAIVVLDVMVNLGAALRNAVGVLVAVSIISSRALVLGLLLTAVHLQSVM